MASTFDQHYHVICFGQSNQDVAVGTLLPRLSDLDKWSQAGTFGTCHELERELNNSRTQILAETRLGPRGKTKSLSHTLLELSYNFTMTLLIHTYAVIRILSCRGFLEKNILSLLSDHLRNIFDDLYQASIMGRNELGSSTVEKTSVIIWATL